MITGLPYLLLITAWLLALVEFILGLYILVLAIPAEATPATGSQKKFLASGRQISVLLILLSISTISAGFATVVIGSGLRSDPALADVRRIWDLLRWLEGALAALVPAIPALNLLVLMILIRPDRVATEYAVGNSSRKESPQPEFLAEANPRWKLVFRAILTLAFIPVFLTLFDIWLSSPLLGRPIWYVGLEQPAFAFVDPFSGFLAPAISILYFYAIPVLALLWIVFHLIFSRHYLPNPLTGRRLLWFLLAAQAGAVAGSVAAAFLPAFLLSTFPGMGGLNSAPVAATLTRLAMVILPNSLLSLVYAGAWLRSAGRVTALGAVSRSRVLDGQETGPRMTGPNSRSPATTRRGARDRLGSLPNRATLLILVVLLPILFSMIAIPSIADQISAAEQAAGSISQVQGYAWVVALFGAVLLSAAVWFTLHKVFRYVSEITVTAEQFAARLAAGELEHLDLSPPGTLEATQPPPAAALFQTTETARLAEAYNYITLQVGELVHGLEQRVEERTALLQSRAIQLHTAAQVAREAAAIQDLKLLLNQTTRLISERFGFYHVGIFLIDEMGEYAVLQAANSPGGQRMLQRGHKLQVGKMGIVGYVASTARPRITLNVGEDTVYLNNPDLPLTRSEMALPMKARGQVIGVLDVQSTKPQAFHGDDVEVLQILADQVALAIENARLLRERETALTELETQYKKTTRLAWQQSILQEQGENQAVAFHYNRFTHPVVQPVSSFPKGADQPASPALSPENTPGTPGDGVAPTPVQGLREIALPIILRDQVLGSIVLRKDEEQEPWTVADTQLVEAALTGIAQALENARLLEENQRRAQQERLISEVTARVQRSLDLETLMKTAVQEVAQATRATRVQIRLNDPVLSERLSEGGEH